MRIVLLSAAACAGIFLAACKPTNPSSPAATTQSNLNEANAYAVLPPAEYEQKLKATNGAVLVDVRTPAEFAAGSLANAQNIDYNAADFQQKIQQLDRNQPLFIFCQRGGRSSNATEVCKKLGFKQVYDLEGGYEAWTASGRK